MTQDPRSQIIAIDPGVNGAWAILRHQGEFIKADELPRFDKLVDAVAFGALVASYAPASAVIEKVGAMPGQGVTSMFTFGAAYGVAIGVIGGYGIPFALITPAKWKAHFRLAGKPKDAARELAIRLYPEAAPSLSLKKHHGRADAILLARYALAMDTGERHP
jgi:crossover junction endodeoxyribonuclease RuvC